MADVVVLRSNFDNTAWKSAFADSLIGLCPELNPDAADELADSAVLHAKDLDPSTAARRWARAQHWLPQQGDGTHQQKVNRA